jgi:D-aminoacyl-tRNA deacylase
MCPVSAIETQQTSIDSDTTAESIIDLSVVILHDYLHFIYSSCYSWSENTLKLKLIVDNILRPKGCSMRCVVQRVDRVDVRVGEKCISSIEKGILVFLGVAQGDRESDADYLSDKIVNLRIFEDEKRKMNLSLIDINGEMLIVSQFTLLGDCRKGRRPSFTGAQSADLSKKLYDYFIKKTAEKVKRVAQGAYQAMMFIELINNGPVTILLDSKKNF